MSIDCRERLSERLPARPGAVARLRRAVVELADECGASERQCEDIALAVSEALSNVVVHAYVACDRPGTIAVDVRARGRSLEVIVHDTGRGLIPRTDSPGLGLGLDLIDRLTERLEFEDAAPGVRVRMMFAIG